MKCRIVFCLLAFVCIDWSYSQAWADPPCRIFGRKSVLMPAPFGTHVNGWFDAQAASAEADQFVIYPQEWFRDGTTLGPYGSYHLQRITQRLPGVPFQVIIQPNLHDAKINQARQTFIINHLLAAGINDAQARVAVAFPRAEGLRGDEATRIYQQHLLGNSGGQQGGNAGSGGGSSGGVLGLPGGGAMGGSRGY